MSRNSNIGIERFRLLECEICGNTYKTVAVIMSSFIPYHSTRICATCLRKALKLIEEESDE